ncbi:UNKNOWN [Stylonychia lemnae]|uniref:Uncharacterized protein n=1 Tax=Stylonychia lemnae TaxID=5949 RepID=A0A078B7F6_STYLE|nr:UNKNOWN [Stylonychia lemnae]|eukprot:CDW90425.1 UNKNOWN [Stylonychia lemnae]
MERNQKSIFLDQFMQSINNQNVGDCISERRHNQSIDHNLVLPKLQKNDIVKKAVGKFFQKTDTTQLVYDYSAIQQQLRKSDHSKFLNKLKKIKSNNQSPQYRLVNEEPNQRYFRFDKGEDQNKENILDNQNADECLIMGRRIRPKFKINITKGQGKNIQSYRQNPLELVDKLTGRSTCSRTHLMKQNYENENQSYKGSDIQERENNSPYRSGKVSVGQQTYVSELVLSNNVQLVAKEFDSISEGEESSFENYDEVGCLMSKNLIFDGDSSNKSSLTSPKNFNKNLYNFSQQSSPIKKWLMEERVQFFGIKVEITKNHKKIL